MLHLKANAPRASRFPRCLMGLLLAASGACSPGVTTEPPGSGGNGPGTATGGSGSGTGGATTGAGGAGTAPGTGGSVAGTGGAAAGTGGAGTAGSGGRAAGTGGAAATGGAGVAGSGGRAGGTGGRAGGTGGATTPGTGGAPAGTGGAGGASDRSPDAVCARWRADRANLAEGTWSGNLASCTVGDISADGRANALRQFNLMRWLAELPPVVTEPSRDAQAQACALMMDANNSLSHSPPTSWTCYTAEGASGASSSNISSGPGVSSVNLYMVDTGNETTHGHRRIILSNALGPIGLGSTGMGGASCMQNLRGTGNAGKAWMAWPPPGAFPLQAYAPSTRSTLSMTGWSIQSQNMTFTNATVTVTSAGMARPVTVSQLTGRYGESNAIRVVPMGWDVAAGQTYSVSVAGTTTPINYEFQIVNCM